MNLITHGLLGNALVTRGMATTTVVPLITVSSYPNPFAVATTIGLDPFASTTTISLDPFASTTHPVGTDPFQATSIYAVGLPISRSGFQAIVTQGYGSVTIVTQGYGA